MTLQGLLPKFRERRIGVVGDMVADVYVYGKPMRLSREAPVMIVRYDSETMVPGSAANTLNNLLALGAEVHPFGVLGGDREGLTLFEVLEKAGARTAGLLVTPGRLTTSKTRILAGDVHISKQQVIRIDKEGDRGLSEDEERRLLAALEAALPTLDAVIVSDYGYGAVTDAVHDLLISSARRCPLVVDSHDRLAEFRGATIITPNQPEAEALAGFAIQDRRDLLAAGRAALDKGGFEAVLLTLGNAGMALFERGGRVTRFPIAGKDEVTDVTGAGDTVAAVLTLALACGESLLEAAWLANVAAGVVVMKRGTATVSPEELGAALAAHPAAPAETIQDGAS